MYLPIFRTCEGQNYVYYVPICISLQLKDKYNECMNLTSNVSVTVNVTSFLSKYETVFRSHTQTVRQTILKNITFKAIKAIKIHVATLWFCKNRSVNIQCLLKFFQFACLVSIWGKLTVNIYASLVWLICLWYSVYSWKWILFVFFSCGNIQQKFNKSTVLHERSWKVDTLSKSQYDSQLINL